MTSLTVMPNFTIMAEVSNKHYMRNLFGILGCYCVREANEAYVDSYKITPESFWYGMNTVPEVDFIQLLKDNAKTEIPSNVLTDLEKFKSRFGLIEMIGDDCLHVKNEDVFTEIKNNTKLNEMIYEFDGSLIFFEGDIQKIQSILHNDIFCPIKFRTPKRSTFILIDKLGPCLFQDKVGSYAIKASNPLEALKALYGKHKRINEETLRSRMNYKKEVITEEVLNAFIQLTFEDIKSDLSMLVVPKSINQEPAKL